MNKKILIIIIVAAITILVAGFLVFKYLGQAKGINTENTAGGANIEKPAESTDVPKVEIEAVGGTGKGGGLTICADRCGDNVCQNTAPECAESSLNCVCVETPQDCPADCK
ncbi:MAG: hypothetical protein AAB509_01955 [Patescibacteria group bacterium]